MSLRDDYDVSGYVSGLTIFEGDEVEALERGFGKVSALLEPYEASYSMDGWEQHNNWLHSIVTNRQLLDFVEEILGPNFFQWGSNMMSKAPGERLFVPWHQDLFDWPLRPSSIATVWLAIDNVDEENGCVRVIPGSHKSGLQQHFYERPGPRNGCKSLLPFHLDPDVIIEQDAVSLPLKAGQISVHSPLLFHYSEGNTSQRRRCGIQICYASTDVACIEPVRTRNGDWTDFAGFLCRGQDDFHNFRHLDPPLSFGRGPRRHDRELSPVGS